MSEQVSEPPASADIARALAHDRVVDITTTGRRSGQPRRIEIWMFNVGGSLYISGWPGPRDWYANILAAPELTLHLKESAHADLPARARPVTEPAERRAIIEQFGGALGGTDDMVAGSPLIEVELLPRP